VFGGARGSSGRCGSRAPEQVQDLLKH
jgi:hypothetical protein